MNELITVYEDDYGVVKCKNCDGLLCVTYRNNKGTQLYSPTKQISSARYTEQIKDIHRIHCASCGWLIYDFRLEDDLTV